MPPTSKYPKARRVAADGKLLFAPPTRGCYATIIGIGPKNGVKLEYFHWISAVVGQMDNASPLLYQYCVEGRRALGRFNFTMTFSPLDLDWDWIGLIGMALSQIYNE